MHDDEHAVSDMRLEMLRSQYRTVFEGDAGEAVLRDLYEFCGLFMQAHVPGDPFHTAFNDGKRRVALRINAMLSERPSARQREVDDDES